jgi:hypothetical protein
MSLLNFKVSGVMPPDNVLKKVPAAKVGAFEDACHHKQSVRMHASIARNW